MSTAPRPTDAELAILRVLWQRGPSTVRDIAAELNRQRDVGYTTVLKHMQIMTEKGLLLRDESNRTHIYRTRLSEEKTLRQLVNDLLHQGLRRQRAKARDAGAGSEESVPPGAG